MQMPKHRPNI